VRFLGRAADVDTDMDMWTFLLLQSVGSVRKVWDKSRAKCDRASVANAAPCQREALDQQPARTLAAALESSMSRRGNG
jgi:hypothetical protein